MKVIRHNRLRCQGRASFLDVKNFTNCFSDFGCLSFTRYDFAHISRIEKTIVSFLNLVNEPSLILLQFQKLVLDFVLKITCHLFTTYKNVLTSTDCCTIIKVRTVLCTIWCTDIRYYSTSFCTSQ